MPENQNKPKKKRGVLWVIIIILIVVLAATAGGYALSYYNALPAWVTDILPDAAYSAPEESQPATPQPDDFQQAIPEPSTTPSPEPEDKPSSADTVTEQETAPAASVSEPVQSPAAVTSAPYIGADAAAEAALKHSKVAQKDAQFSSVMFEESNGVLLYKAVFTAGDYVYEYYLDVYTGRVESWAKTELNAEETETPAFAETDVSAAAMDESASEEKAQSSATVLLGEDEATKLAMDHANITEKDISSVDCRIELQGLSLIYRLDIKTKLMEYEYQIDAITGDILSFDAQTLKTK